MSDLIKARKGIFIPDITVEMFRNASLEAVEELLVSGEMQDIILPSAEPERKLELHGDESAIEILSELRSWFSCFDEKEGLAYHALSLAIRAIKANSIVQAERKKGKWQWCGNHHLCSECDEWALTRWNEDECDEVDILTDFCPNCGADMRGDSDV